MTAHRIQKRFITGLLPAFAVCMFLLQTAAGAAAESRHRPETTGGDQAAEVSAHLFFPDRKGEFLKSEIRKVRGAESSADLAIRIVNSLIEGPNEDLLPVCSNETKLLALYITDEGTAVVDFNTAIKENHLWEVNSERMTIYSIVNSLVLNVEAISTVKFLIEGQEPVTLAGHWDVRHPLKANMLLIR